MRATVAPVVTGQRRMIRAPTAGDTRAVISCPVCRHHVQHIISGPAVNHASAGDRIVVRPPFERPRASQNVIACAPVKHIRPALPIQRVIALSSHQLVTGGTTCQCIAMV